MTAKSAIRSFFIEGRAGRLEALLNEASGSPQYAALVAHPHPLYGGTMHNKVVFKAMKALSGLGMPVLRFNFRGVGLSGGTHDGRAESEDVSAAVRWLDREFHLPIVFAGFSFGAATGLRACCPDQRVVALISLGTPINADGRVYRFGFLESCAKPKLFVSGGQDEFGPRAELEALVSRIPGPKRLVILEGAGHFFDGKLNELRRTIEQWVKEYLAG